MVTIHLRLRTLIYFALVVFAAYVIWTVLFDVVLLLLVSAIFLAALEPIVERIEKSGLPRGVAILAVMFVIAAAAALVGFLVVPALFTQITDLLSNLPSTVDRLRGLLRDRGLDKQFSSQLDQIQVPSNLAGHVLGASTAALCVAIDSGATPTSVGGVGTISSRAGVTAVGAGSSGLRPAACSSLGESGA